MKKFILLCFLALIISTDAYCADKQTHQDFFNSLRERVLKENIRDEIKRAYVNGDISTVEYEYFLHKPEELKISGDEYLKCVSWQDSSENFDNLLFLNYDDSRKEFEHWWRENQDKHTINEVKKELRYLVKKYGLNRNKISLD